MHQRIKAVRQAANLTQDDFAAKINLTKNFVSLIETGKRMPSDRTISDICREFGVNEDWLRNGTGGDDNMYVVPVKSHDEEVSAFFGKIMAAEGETVQKRWAYAFSRLPPELWDELDKIMRELAEGYAK